MARLGKRLAALEAKRPANDFSHLTDEQLAERLVHVCERIEPAAPSGINWRGLLGDPEGLCRAVGGQIERVRGLVPCVR